MSNFDQIAVLQPANSALRTIGVPNDIKPTLPFRRLSGLGDRTMDKDRVIGSAKEVKGTVKQVAGKTVGDAKLEADGKADKIEGRIQNAIGGLKDKLKGMFHQITQGR